MAHNSPVSYIKKSSAGFTLLEILVVLVLLSMVMTMLMQGLSMIYNIRSRILVQINELRVNRLREHLLVDLLSAITPDHPKGDAVFAGDENGIYGLSLLSLQSDVGVPVQIRLWGDNADEQSRLLYQQGDSMEVEIGRWQSTTVQFTFFTKDGEEYHTWPPRNSSLPQLPSAIMIRVGEEPEYPVWFVPILGRTEARPNVQEHFEL